MIALMFLIAIAVWLVVVTILTIFIPRIVKQGWLRIVVRLILFLVLLVAPIADEWIGKMQFNDLCKKEAVIKLSSDWRSVKRAKDVSTGPNYLGGYFIRIKEYHDIYLDIDTGQKFLEFKTFITKGGMLSDRFGFGLGGSISCSPPDRSQVFHMINIDELLKRGEIK